jgi:hypothetical protein
MLFARSCPIADARVTAFAKALLFSLLLLLLLPVNLLWHRLPGAARGASWYLAVHCCLFGPADWAAGDCGGNSHRGSLFLSCDAVYWLCNEHEHLYSAALHFLLEDLFCQSYQA